MAQLPAITFTHPWFVMWPPMNVTTAIFDEGGRRPARELEPPGVARHVIDVARHMPRGLTR